MSSFLSHFWGLFILVMKKSQHNTTNKALCDLPPAYFLTLPHTSTPSWLYSSDACFCHLHLLFLLAGMAFSSVWLTPSCCLVLAKRSHLWKTPSRLPHLKQLSWLPIHFQSFSVPSTYHVFFTCIILSEVILLRCLIFLLVCFLHENIFDSRDFVHWLH